MERGNLMITNVGSKWVGGDLVFYDKVTGDTIFTIKADSKMLGGSQFTVQFPQIAAADVAKTFFIAPAACKVVSGYERHVTVAGQAGVLTVEKLNSGEAPGAGDDLFTAGWDLTSTANTPVSINAVDNTLAAGDSLCLKLQSGAATSYALGTLTLTMEWI